jgi:hypothetical protein
LGAFGELHGRMVTDGLPIAHCRLPIDGRGMGNW